MYSALPFFNSISLCNTIVDNGDRKILFLFAQICPKPGDSILLFLNISSVLILWKKNGFYLLYQWAFFMNVNIFFK